MSHRGDPARAARPSAIQVQRAMERVGATVAWEPGAVPSEVVDFLGAAVVDRETLSREVVALRQALASTEEVRASVFASGSWRQLLLGLASGALVILGSIFGTAFFATPG